MAREMSENEFYELQGNSFRGSRYSNFVGGGVTPQGNVSSAATENAANAVGTSADGAAGGQPTPDQPVISQGLTSNEIKTPSTSDLVIGAAAPYAGSVIGGVAGSAVGAGSTFGEGISRGVSALANKVSGGLIGTAASSPTNLAIGQLGGKFGPATPSSVSGISNAGSLGSAIGTGFGTAAATLLTGGSVKQAATSGIGSGVGYAIGSAFGPVGSVVGSFLGSTIGGLFGGKKPSVQWQKGLLDLNSGKIQYGGQGGKKYSAGNRKTIANSLKAAQDYAKQLEAAGYKRDPNAWGFVKVTADNKNGVGIVSVGDKGKKATTKYYGRNAQKFMNDLYANIRNIYGVQQNV